MPNKWVLAIRTDASDYGHKWCIVKVHESREQLHAAGALYYPGVDCIVVRPTSKQNVGGLIGDDEYNYS